MIFILSTKNDFTTNLVQDWLCYFKKPNIRLNESVKNISFNGNVDLIELDQIKIVDVESYWYRKGTLFNNLNKSNQIVEADLAVTKELIYYLFHIKKGIGNFPSKNEVNKLIALEQAKTVGLKIPETFIVETKQEIKNLLNKTDKQYVTKMKTETTMFQFDDDLAIVYTNDLNKDSLDFIPDNFASTLIQEKIDKQFEIRTFYLDSQCWSMAIFSQRDKKTKDDYRRYNYQNPNRHVPFKIPADLENQVCKLMKNLNLRTGSIDFILSKDNEFIFLEINPTGQFTNLSMTCNYPLEKIIAEKL